MFEFGGYLCEIKLITLYCRHLLGHYHHRGFPLEALFHQAHFKESHEVVPVNQLPSRLLLIDARGRRDWFRINLR